ncbi:MAG: NAD(P)/FAD-dependent oxidoreductase [Verrucomicrobiota bacterium]
MPHPVLKWTAKAAITDAALTGPAHGKVIIIGAGVAGLSCGCYLQMNGVQTEILEAAGLPGGLCTAWHRGRYVFDGCLRWLMGAQPPSAFYQVWTELGAIAGRQVFIHDEILRIEWPDGTSLDVPSDLDELTRRFKRLAPEDSALIDKLVRDARRCASLEPPLNKPLELMGAVEKTRLGLRYLPIAPVVFRYKNVPITRYAARYKSKILREALEIIVGNEHMSALVLVMLLAFRTRKNTGFVAGGSWDFSMAIADRYQKLGGRLRLNCPVASVQVEDGYATGVACADGACVPAATVVSCADGHTTIFKMLEGKFVDRKVRFLYDHCQTFPAILQISLGIKKVFPGAPHTLNLPLRQPLRVDDDTCHARLEVEAFGPESLLCPEGTTLMTVRLPTLYEFWTGLKKNEVLRYRAEKRRILEEIITALEQRFPGLKPAIERSDMATPATYFRYTGNWQGSYEGWLPTPRILGRRIPYTLPRLKNFYMAGHWVVPGGGLPSAALAGRYVAQLICDQFGKKFVAQTP